MVNKKTLRGSTLKVAAVILPVVMAFSSSMPVMAKESDSTVIATEATTELAPSATDFDLTGVWEYLQNDANNPSPTLTELGGNQWELTLYQGTEVAVYLNQIYGEEYPIACATSPQYVATACYPANINFYAGKVGTQTLWYMVNDSFGNQITYTCVRITVNVIPAEAGTGDGTVTNAAEIAAQAAASTTTASATSSVATTDNATQILSLLNSERQALGLQPLHIDSAFQKEAERRAQEVAVDFNHNNFYVASNCYAAECICDRDKPKTVISSFKASSAHWGILTIDGCDCVGVACAGGRTVIIIGRWETQEEIEAWKEEVEAEMDAEWEAYLAAGLID